MWVFATARDERAAGFTFGFDIVLAGLEEIPNSTTLAACHLNLKFHKVILIFKIEWQF